MKNFAIVSCLSLGLTLSARADTTPLEYFTALVNCDQSKVQKLVQDGADPNFAFQNGQVPLEASWNCPLPQFQFLRGAGARLDVGYFAGENIINRLLLSYVNNGNPYLGHPRPVNKDFPLILDSLGEAGLSFNASSTVANYPSDTPLGQLAWVTPDAYAYKDIRAVSERLIRWRANPNLRDEYIGGAPLWRALSVGNLRVASVLVKNGADINADGAWARAADLYEALERNGGPEQANDLVQLFQQILPKVANLKEVTDGVPLAFQAVPSCVSHYLPALPAGFDRLFAVKDLVAAGIDFTRMTDADGNNILGYVLKNRLSDPIYLTELDEDATIELAKYLLSLGVRPDQKNKQGLSPVELAAQRKFAKLQDFLGGH